MSGTRIVANAWAPSAVFVRLIARFSELFFRKGKGLEASSAMGVSTG